MMACALLGTALLAMAPLAAEPAPTRSELPAYQCRIVPEAGCGCWSREGGPAISYAALLDRLAREAATRRDDRSLVALGTEWRRQCGVTTEEDVP